MEVLQLLGTALGISAMAGINLYLTVFATSLALNMGWLHLSPQMQSLQVLADPAILMISGGLYFLEFFVDKVPGLDSLWDSVHTAIRPLGAMFMSLALLGQTDVTLEIVTALLCGGVALSTHATKLGVRAVINTSPEPFTNTVASVTEDFIVAGGLALSYTHPLAAAVGVVVFLVAFAWFAPKLFRFVRMVFVFGWSRLSSGGGSRPGMPLDISAGHREQLGEFLSRGQTLSWCVRGFTGRSALFPAGFVCYLFRSIDVPDVKSGVKKDMESDVESDAGSESGSDTAKDAAIAEEQNIAVHGNAALGLFVPHKKHVQWFDVGTLEISVKTRFLFYEFVLYDTVKQQSVVVRFSRRDGERLKEEFGVKG